FGGPTTPGDTVAGFPRSDPGTGLRSGDALPGGWCATTWDRAGDAPAALTGGHSHTGEEPLWSAQGGQRIIRVGIQTAEGGDDVVGVGAVVHARNPEGIRGTRAGERSEGDEAENEEGDEQLSTSHNNAPTAMSQLGARPPTE